MPSRPWQHQVQDDEVGSGVAGQFEAGEAIAGGGNPVAVLLQIEANDAGDARVVFDDQHVMGHGDWNK